MPKHEDTDYQRMAECRVRGLIDPDHVGMVMAAPPDSTWGEGVLVAVLVPVWDKWVEDPKSMTEHSYDPSSWVIPKSLCPLHQDKHHLRLVTENERDADRLACLLGEAAKPKHKDTT